MRRFLTVSLVAAALATTSFAGSVAVAADPEGCPALTVDQNIEVVRSYIEAQVAGDMAAMDAALSDDHVGAATMGSTEMMGTNEDEHTLAMAVQAIYPGSTYRLDEVFGVDDKVVVSGALVVPAHMLTGQMVTMETPAEARVVAIFTLACGQIVRTDSVIDTYGLLVALGVMPAPMPPDQMMQGK